jgi:hypothetical protein
MSATNVVEAMTETELDQSSVDTIRTLSIDAVQLGFEPNRVTAAAKELLGRS